MKKFFLVLILLTVFASIFMLGVSGVKQKFTYFPNLRTDSLDVDSNATLPAVTLTGTTAITGKVSFSDTANFSQLWVLVDTFGADKTVDTITKDTTIIAEVSGFLTWTTFPDSLTAYRISTTVDSVFVTVNKAENGGIYKLYLMGGKIK